MKKTLSVIRGNAIYIHENKGVLNICPKKWENEVEYLVFFGL